MSARLVLYVYAHRPSLAFQTRRTLRSPNALRPSKQQKVEDGRFHWVVCELPRRAIERHYHPGQTTLRAALLEVRVVPVPHGSIRQNTHELRVIRHAYRAPGPRVGRNAAGYVGVHAKGLEGMAPEVSADRRV